MSQTLWKGDKMKSKHEPWSCCLGRNPEGDRGLGTGTCAGLWAPSRAAPGCAEPRARCLLAKASPVCPVPPAQCHQPSATAAQRCPCAGVAQLPCCPWVCHSSPMDSAPLAHPPGAPVPSRVPMAPVSSHSWGHSQPLSLGQGWCPAALRAALPG